MHFAPLPSQDRVNAFQKKLKLTISGLVLCVSFLFLSQAVLELFARQGFSPMSGTVHSIISYHNTFPGQKGVWTSNFFHQNFGTSIEYQYIAGSATYVGRDTISNNHPPSKRATPAFGVKKGDVLEVLVSNADPEVSRLPRPFAYPLGVGGLLFLTSVYLFAMRNDKTPPYYMQNIED